MNATRGWRSTRLEVVPDTDPKYWSVADAAERVTDEPTLTEPEWRQLVRLAGLVPAGKRRNGARRRHVRVFLAADLVQLHTMLKKAREWAENPRKDG